TPFENQEISFNRLAENIKKWNNFPLAGYVVLGSNGENVMLSESDCLHMVETAIKYVPDDRCIIIGAGSESTQMTIEFIKQVHRIGGDAALVISPHYYRDQMKPAVLEHYFLEVAEKSPMPVIIYNVPKFTGLEVSVEVISRVGSHPNIIGMKDSSGNITYQQSILHLGLENFHLLTGTANTLMPSLIMGAAGGILALANIAPQICLNIYQWIKQQKFEEARQLQLQIIRLNQLTTGIYGIGGLKYAMDQIGFFGGNPRRPLKYPDDQEKQQILTELKKLKLLP
ncbi:MAG: dihydrodipicolinate synthase family protein, partial [Calditrichaeota bacterium]